MNSLRFRGTIAKLGRAVSEIIAAFVWFNNLISRHFMVHQDLRPA